MDAIFGRKNFRNEIVWSYRSGGGSKHHFGRKHDTILFYSKGKQWTFNADAVRVPYDAIIAKSRESAFHRLGKVSGDVWNISRPPNHSKELIGYPTQKPLALYERIIQASSNPGDMVLDPFCGCATTPVAAERLGRQWVGMDLWDGALDIVRQRMEDNRQLLTDIPTVHYETAPPVRTDGGGEAAPFIQVAERYADPDGPRMSRAEMYAYLLAQHGQRCQGCDRVFDDARYLELDHNTPRSDGGLNHITNRVLLCGPCNRTKSNTYTLSGLRRVNKKNGWMAGMPGSSSI